MRLIKEVLDEPKKRFTAYSFIVYFPLISILVGAPIPLPYSLFTVSSEQIAFLNSISLLITITGSIIGIGFYLERRQNLKLDKQNDKMDKIDKEIEQAVIVTGEHIKDARNDMREIERRLCALITSTVNTIERNIEDKVVAAKALEDERIRNIHNRLNRLEGGGREGFRYYNEEEEKK